MMQQILEFIRTNNAQIIGIFASLFLIYTVFMLVKTGRLQERYSLIWFLIAFFILTISVFRPLLEYFARFLGIIYAPNALFAVMVGCAYLLMLNISISLSAVKRQNKTLIQEVGLLRSKLEKLENQPQNNNEDRER
jgi:hypothetical protein